MLVLNKPGVKNNLTFNHKPKHKSKSLYYFNRYLTSFEKGNYKLFVKNYYKLKPNQVKYWRIDPI